MRISQLIKTLDNILDDDGDLEIGSLAEGIAVEATVALLIDKHPTERRTNILILTLDPIVSIK